MRKKYTANQDIRDYMEDRGVSQRRLAESINTNQTKICTMLRKELSQKEKEDLLRHIDAIAEDTACIVEEDEPIEDQADFSEQEEEAEDTDDVSVCTRFQIGDRVKIPSKSLIVGTVSDIWSSLAKQSIMYAVNTEDGSCGLYAENQLEPAPLPIDYSFEAHIDGNVAVVTMIATQGEKTWIYARGHAHILHDGEVGMAQAVSFASKRMLESLDTKQENRIYFKDGGNK